MKSKVEDMRKKAEEKPVQPAPAPLETAQVPAEQGKAEESDESEEDPALASAQRAASSIGQARGRGRGGSRGRGSHKASQGRGCTAEHRTKRVLSAARSQSGRSAAGTKKAKTDTDSAPSSSAQAASESGRSRSPTGSQREADRLVGQARKYKGLLTLPRILAGSNLGQDPHQAKRVKEALEKQPMLTDSYLDFASHMQLCDAAQKLSVQKIAALTKLERESLLEQVDRKLDAIPPEWAVSVLTAHVRDWLPELKAKDVEMYVKSIMPSECASGCVVKQCSLHLKLRASRQQNRVTFKLGS